jgi:hypothetical protein
MTLHQLFDDIALTDGEWRNVGGIQRWVSTKPRRRDIDVHDLIACPTCFARVDETCRTRGGNVTGPHGSRLAPRLCSCGGRLKHQRRMCDACAHEATRISKRDYLRRRRANDKEAAA